MFHIIQKLFTEVSAVSKASNVGVARHQVAVTQVSPVPKTHTVGVARDHPPITLASPVTKLPKHRRDQASIPKASPVTNLSKHGHQRTPASHNIDVTRGHLVGTWTPTHATDPEHASQRTGGHNNAWALSSLVSALALQYLPLIFGTTDSHGIALKLVWLCFFFFASLSLRRRQHWVSTEVMSSSDADDNMLTKVEDPGSDCTGACGLPALR